MSELSKHVLAMFRAAKRDGLYIGSGYNHRLDDDEQEGPMVKKLRKLAEAEEKHAGPNDKSGEK